MLFLCIAILYESSYFIISNVVNHFIYFLAIPRGFSPLLIRCLYQDPVRGRWITSSCNCEGSVPATPAKQNHSINLHRNLIFILPKRNFFQFYGLFDPDRKY